jgi:hypothetical protein
MIPSWIPLEAWDGYCAMRKQKKKPMTAGALTRTLNSLERMMQEGEDITLVLNQSEDQGYVGVFPVFRLLPRPTRLNRQEECYTGTTN